MNTYHSTRLATIPDGTDEQILHAALLARTACVRTESQAARRSVMATNESTRHWRMEAAFGHGDYFPPANVSRRVKNQRGQAAKAFRFTIEGREGRYKITGATCKWAFIKVGEPTPAFKF